jgi:hypothetical protein
VRAREEEDYREREREREKERKKSHTKKDIQNFSCLGFCISARKKVFFPFFFVSIFWKRDF